MHAKLEDFNSASAETATELLLSCCSCPSWAAALQCARPYADLSHLSANASRIWRQSSEADILSCFRGHAQIGGNLDSKDQTSKAWGAQEQSGATSAEAEVKQQLRQKNQEYLDKFGFIFLIFASGKSAATMLASLQERLGNSRAQELRLAAEEQEKIFLLRLRKIFMNSLSTHILDTARGQPASGMQVQLYRQRAGADFELVNAGVSDANGRIAQLHGIEPLPSGVYKLHFACAEYYAQRGQDCFYPYVEIVCTMPSSGEHYHVPLLISGYGFSSYRGS